MSETKDTTVALNVRLKPVDYSNLPRQVNYSNVGMAQGVAYVAALLNQHCWLPLRSPQKAAKAYRKPLTASLSLAWPWE